MTKNLCGVALAVVLGVAGCGGGEDGASVDNFVGTWNYTSGTSTTNCGGQSQTDMLTGGTTFSKGISSALVSSADGCTLQLDVNGSTASAKSGQECNQTSQGATVTLKLTAYTFTVNGIVADESASATLTGNGPGGTVNCTYTSTGKLMKISK
jgi:hypothetical protein